MMQKFNTEASAQALYDVLFQDTDTTRDTPDDATKAEWLRVIRRHLDRFGASAFAAGQLHGQQELKQQLRDLLGIPTPPGA